MKQIIYTYLTLILMLISGCSEAKNNLFQGYVEGEYVHIAAPLGGYLTTLSVHRGQQVVLNEPLFVLERDFERAAMDEATHALQSALDNLANLEKGQRPSEIASIEAKLKQAKASSSLARIEYNRRVKLIKEQTISQEELDQAKSDYDQKKYNVRNLSAQLTTARLGARSDEIRSAAAQVKKANAKLDQAKWNFNRKSQVAPSNALVYDTLFQVGEWVQPGQPVVSLLPPENIEIRFYVPEAFIGDLEIGQKVNVIVDGRLTPTPATVYYISPSAEYTPPVIYSSESRAKLVFMIKARPTQKSNSQIHPGQPVDITIPDLFHEKSTLDK
ncbi:HlyD family efflux transporter periplasmic adaptor subunit [Pseudodesulfovibrio sp. zrk46]|uniref:HlyD family secretion protein n=1 Tax=Pseudodesulfovibrio sp. zrk46 TaxID=2725288 RepID=UPI001448E41C|nr:HlyD family efflux transporter periplasmic adaptor subunit [Pseudodesulfovibrio sp. zrk46]QJB57580.1 HlyD family efflux transporter periplasmic adaptor subunit [Pseudodesulfovibrio sp. zrk46]